MATLGLRCWPDRFAYVVAEGTRKRPELVTSDILRLPQNMTRPCALNWLHKELNSIASKYSIRGCRYKAVEPMAQKTMSLLERAQVEGVVQGGVYEAGCRDIEGLRKTQIKRLLSFAGPAKHVTEALTDSPFSRLSGTDCQEAALAAWCALGEE